MAHAQPLELHQVHDAGGGHVVAKNDRVPHLFGGPSAHPCPPRFEVAELPSQADEVVREVVLGEEVDGERRCARPREVSVRVRSTKRVGHQFVREPLLRRVEVASQQPIRHLAECRQDLIVVHERMVRPGKCL